MRTATAIHNCKMRVLNENVHTCALNVIQVVLYHLYKILKELTEHLSFICCIIVMFYFTKRYCFAPEHC